MDRHDLRYGGVGVTPPCRRGEPSAFLLIVDHRPWKAPIASTTSGAMSGDVILSHEGGATQARDCPR